MFCWLFTLDSRRRWRPSHASFIIIIIISSSQFRMQQRSGSSTGHASHVQHSPSPIAQKQTALARCLIDQLHLHLHVRPVLLKSTQTAVMRLVVDVVLVVAWMRLAESLLGVLSGHTQVEVVVLCVTERNEGTDDVNQGWKAH
jgi:hypothetical protein